MIEVCLIYLATNKPEIFFNKLEIFFIIFPIICGNMITAPSCFQPSSPNETNMPYNHCSILFLLARILSGKYCYTSAFLEVSPPAPCSHEWRSILHGRALLKGNLGKEIGNRSTTKVWQDS